MVDFDTLVERRKDTSAKWQVIHDEMGDGCDDVLALSVADMEFPTCPAVTEAIINSAKHDILGYDHIPDEYYDALGSWMGKHHHLEVKPEQVTTTAGVMPAVLAALRAITHPGDKVILQRPVYYPFTHAAEYAGLTILDNELVRDSNGHYSIDFEDLTSKAADPRCKAMLVCNPHNPVGRVWTRDELTRMADICLSNDVTILADEIHADFSYDGHEVTMMSNLSDEVAQHCMEFTAPTKTFNLAGLACSNAIIKNTSLKRDFDIAVANAGGLTVNHFGYVACQAAYEHGEAWLDDLRKYLAKNLSIVRDFADSQHDISLIEPEGTYLAWLDCNGLGMNNEELKNFMRTKARIFMDEGCMFGASGSGFERVNMACPASFLSEAMERIAVAVAVR
ncbi:MalY/PatB family protein [Bifidobacterium aquikefiricola]|uniref:cysteine-S-conjugate beta-lyase n=1 Tax=Bifidobacterium aquikefiricola TaxID=3059038 RepID=A0AB39U8X3_9BIFI